MALQAHNAAMGHATAVEAPSITSPAHHWEDPPSLAAPDEKFQNQ